VSIVSDDVGLIVVWPLEGNSVVGG
jgi:hypothetical protein